LNSLSKEFGFSITFDKYLSKLINLINNKVVSHIIYDLEFSSIIGAQDILHISQRTNTESIGLGLDDDRLHEINKMTYAFVDKIFTTPLSKKRYEILGFSAYDFLPLETVLDKNTNKSRHDRKSKPYVLSYGIEKKADREEKIKLIEDNNINIKVIPSDTSYKDLYKEISLAPIIINFSKGSRTVTNPLRMVPFFPSQRKYLRDQFIFQPKGRIYEAGYYNSLCVSEFYPMHESFSEPSRMPVFHNNEEMISILKDLTKNQSMLEDLRESFSKYVQTKFSPEKLSSQIKKDLLEEPRIHSGISISFLYHVSVNTTRFLIYKNPFFLFRLIQSENIIKKILLSFSVSIVSFFCAILSYSIYLKNHNERK